MSDSDRNEQAVEFWRRFRFYILIGLAMILALITGFTYRHSLYDEGKKQANGELFALLSAADAGEVGEADAFYATLSDGADSAELSYLGAFALSSLYVAEKKTDKAKTLLLAAMDGSQDIGLRRLAALRLAEILINLEEYDEAEAVLADNAPPSGRLRILYEERGGDLEFRRGNYDKAKTAYHRAAALAQQDADFYLPLIRIKLGALLSHQKPEAATAAESNDEPEDEPEEQEN